MTTPGRLDRAAAVRRSLLELVADHGFHGASMNAVARRAGVATGTAYVHYPSKDDLVLAVYREVKNGLGVAAVAGVDPADAPRERFARMWRNILDHLLADPYVARFLVQVDASPYADRAHDVAATDEDPLVQAAAAPDLAPLLADLRPEILYELGFGPAVRLAARTGRDDLDASARDALITACWRAITRP